MIQVNQISQFNHLIYRLNIQAFNENVVIRVRSGYQVKYRLRVISGGTYDSGWYDSIELSFNPSSLGTGQKTFLLEGENGLDGIEVRPSTGNKLSNILQWGSTEYSIAPFTLGTSTTFLTNISATDIPNFNKLTNFTNFVLAGTNSTNVFVPNIKHWDVTNVGHFGNVFQNALTIQDIEDWQPKSATTFGNFLNNASNNASNNARLSNIYKKWVNHLPTYTSGNHTMFFGNAKYDSSAAAARAQIVAKGWTIFDGGQS